MIPGLGRSPGVGNGNSLQYSFLENPMERKACWATVHGFADSDTTKQLIFFFLTGGGRQELESDRGERKERGNESTFVEYLLCRITECLRALTLERGCLSLHPSSASF